MKCCVQWSLIYGWKDFHSAVQTQIKLLQGFTLFTIPAAAVSGSTALKFK